MSILTMQSVDYRLHNIYACVGGDEIKRSRLGSFVCIRVMTLYAFDKNHCGNHIIYVIQISKRVCGLKVSLKGSKTYTTNVPKTKFKFNTAGGIKVAHGSKNAGERLN